MKASAKRRRRELREHEAAENQSGPRAFEHHPFFHRRIQILGREAFFARGPEEPRASTLRAGLVARHGTFYVWLPDQPRARQWYGRQYTIEYVADTPPGLIEKAWARVELDAEEKTRRVLVELGLGGEAASVIEAP